MKLTNVEIHHLLRDRRNSAHERIRDIALSARRRFYALRVDIPRIEAALQRLDAGEYGKCIICDEPIDSARLDMMPEVPSCKNCQKLEPKF